MTRPLETILSQPEIRHPWLRDVALQRLYELNSSQATPYIVDEIRHPHVDNGMFTVKAKTLGVLPKETLPEFDDLLAARLGQRQSRTVSLDAQLLGRYSTKAILSHVKAVYETMPGSWDCVAEDGFVLYFLRTEPDYGVQRLAAAPSVCMTESIPAVMRMKRWGEVEPAVIAQLNNPDPNRARQAAETLSQYGGVKAEKAMWERLRSFHLKWSDRENDFNYRQGIPRDASEASGFQYGLVESIARAPGWILSNEQVTELENLTLGSERDNVKHYHWSSPVALSINILFDSRMHADINHQYFASEVALLCSKLGQYPAGTQFKLTTFGEQHRLAPVLQAISETAAEHGLIVESAR